MGRAWCFLSPPLPVLLILRVVSEQLSSWQFLSPSLPPQAGSAFRALRPVAPSSPLENSSLVLIPRLLVCLAGPLRPVWSGSSWEGYIHWQVPAGAALMVTWSGVLWGRLAGASALVVSPAGWSPWFSSVQSAGPDETHTLVVVNGRFCFVINRKVYEDILISCFVIDQWEVIVFWHNWTVLSLFHKVVWFGTVWFMLCHTDQASHSPANSTLAWLTWCMPKRCGQTSHAASFAHSSSLFGM